MKGWNSAPWQSEEFGHIEEEIRALLHERVRKG
jgi:hypothetical protein